MQRAYGDAKIASPGAKRIELIRVFRSALVKVATNHVQLADQLRRQGRELLQAGRKLIGQATNLHRQFDADTDPSDIDIGILWSAQEAYEARRRRSAFLDTDLFGEPAWDILLDLYIHEHLGRKTSISAACQGSLVPATTALRYIDLLTEKGLVARRQDPKDSRRSWLVMTPKGSSKIHAYFASFD